MRRYQVAITVVAGVALFTLGPTVAVSLLGKAAAYKLMLCLAGISAVAGAFCLVGYGIARRSERPLRRSDNLLADPLPPAGVDLRV